MTKSTFEQVRNAMRHCNPSNIRGYETTAQALGWQLNEVFDEMAVRGEALSNTEHHLRVNGFRMVSSIRLGN